MTTYKATIQNIGSLMTHSIYADTASYTPFSDFATSASYAKTASYAISSSHAISASHALLADSASYYPPQIFQTSCSWASRSLQSWYATRSLDVDTHGPQYNFPFWTSDTPGAGNGNLQRNSPLVYYPSTALVTFDSSSTNVESYIPWPAHRPDFRVWRFSEQANVAWGRAWNAGIQSAWPIVSHTFVGTDYREWTFITTSIGCDTITTNSYYSGSQGDASSGSFYTITAVPGALASIFNGKWVRFVSYGGNPGGNDSIPSSKVMADHSAMGEVWGISDQIMKGLVSLELSTTVFPGGSNAWNQVDMWVHGGDWAGNQSATVLHVHNYGPQLIRAFRISTKGGGLVDPPYIIDVLIDGLYSGGEAPGYLGEPVLTLKARSWQGIRFLKWLNVDPWPLANTGSNDITQDGTQLIFPAAPGYYSNAPKSMNYYIQGKNVVIWPNANELTQSGLAVTSQAKPYSLNVSGGIQTNTRFYCDDHAGLTTKVTYGTTNLYFSGGILIDKYPPDTYVPPVGTPCGGTAKFNGGASMPTVQTYVLGTDIGPVEFKFDMYGVPDRAIVVFDGVNVMDSGYRGTYTPTNQSNLNSYLASYGSASAAIVEPAQGTLYWYKNSATQTAQVLIFAPIPGTAWNFTMSCPNQTI